MMDMTNKIKAQLSEGIKIGTQDHPSPEKKNNTEYF